MKRTHGDNILSLSQDVNYIAFFLLVLDVNIDVNTNFYLNITLCFVFLMLCE